MKKKENTGTNTMVLVSVAYQDHEWQEDIFAETVVFPDWESAVDYVCGRLTGTSVIFHDGDDGWTDADTDKEVDKIMANPERYGKDDVIYRWVRDDETFAYRIKRYAVPHFVGKSAKGKNGKDKEFVKLADWQAKVN